MTADRPAGARSIFFASWDNASVWHRALSAALPGHAIERWSDGAAGPPGDPALYRTAFVWQAPEALFSACRGLQVVCSLGAGSDHILRHRAALAPDATVLRAADPLMAERMAQYVLAAVLAFTQQHDVYRRQQAERRWQRQMPLDAADTPVLLLGVGRLGRRTAELLAGAGFPVTAWARAPRPDMDDSGLPVVSGPAALPGLLASARVLVTLLPETPETSGIVDRRLLDHLPTGSLLVNPGRGGLMVEADVLAALDSGRLAGAVLDAFVEEPLAPDHPFWRHPKVRVTPHSAAISDPDSVSRALAEDLARLDRGEAPVGLVDRSAGY